MERMSNKDNDRMNIVPLSPKEMTKHYTAEDFRANTRIIESVIESRCLVDRIVEDYPLIALDVKGHNLGFGGAISILSLATCDGHCFFFDLITSQQLIVEGKVKYLLENEKIVKVIFDSKAFTQAITSCYNVQTKNIFDVQVGHAIIQSRKSNMSPCDIDDACLCYISDVYGRGLDTSAGHVLRRINADHPNFWEIRPLFCKAAEFAARQVMCLLPEVYENMNALIPSESHLKFMQMVENRINPNHENLDQDDTQDENAKTYVWLEKIKKKINKVIESEINHYLAPKASSTSRICLRKYRKPKKSKTPFNACRVYRAQLTPKFEIEERVEEDKLKLSVKSPRQVQSPKAIQGPESLHYRNQMFDQEQTKNRVFENDKSKAESESGLLFLKTRNQNPQNQENQQLRNQGNQKPQNYGIQNPQNQRNQKPQNQGNQNPQNQLDQRNPLCVQLRMNRPCPPRITNKCSYPSQMFRPCPVKKSYSPFVLVCKSKIPCKECCNMMYNHSLKSKLKIGKPCPTQLYLKQNPLIRSPRAFVSATKLKQSCLPQNCPSQLPSNNVNVQPAKSIQAYATSLKITITPQNNPQKDCIGFIGTKVFDGAKCSDGSNSKGSNSGNESDNSSESDSSSSSGCSSVLDT